MTDAEAAIVILGQFAIYLTLALAIYVVPSVVAFRRRHPNRYAILAINLALGGTGIGWLGALVWAMQAVHLSAEAGGSNGGESGLNLFINDPKPVVVTSAPGTAQGPGFSGHKPDPMDTAVAELERLIPTCARSDSRVAVLVEV